jgi:hypothetical protein
VITLRSKALCTSTEGGLGWPTFTTTEGPIVKIFTEMDREAKQAKMGGRPEFVLTATMNIESVTAANVKLACVIDHDDADAFMAQFVRGVEYKFVVKGFPVKDNDGTLLRYSARQTVMIKTTVDHIVVKVVGNKKSSYSKVLNRASATEVAPMVRAAKDQVSKD